MDTVKVNSESDKVSSQLNEDPTASDTLLSNTHDEKDDVKAYYVHCSNFMLTGDLEQLRLDLKSTTYRSPPLDLTLLKNTTCDNMSIKLPEKNSIPTSSSLNITPRLSNSIPSSSQTPIRIPTLIYPTSPFKSIWSDKESSHLLFVVQSYLQRFKTNQIDWIIISNALTIKNFIKTHQDCHSEWERIQTLSKLQEIPSSSTSTSNFNSNNLITWTNEEVLLLISLVKKFKNENCGINSRGELKSKSVEWKSIEIEMNNLNKGVGSTFKSGSECKIRWEYVRSHHKEKKTNSSFLLQPQLQTLNSTPTNINSMPTIKLISSTAPKLLLPSSANFNHYKFSPLISSPLVSSTTTTTHSSNHSIQPSTSSKNSTPTNKSHKRKLSDSITIEPDTTSNVIAFGH